MKTIRVLLAAVLAVLPALPAAAFNQPPLNLSATSFIDGGGAPPGLYLVEYVIFTEGRAVDKNGDKIPGGARASALASLHQLFYLSKVKLFGAALAWDVLLPVNAVTTSGSFGPAPVTANRAGLGDLVVGPALQWPAKKLLGAPFLQRVEAFAILPTGRYDKSFMANPGSNFTTLEAYYAFSWYFAPAWETSWRVQYGYHTENPDTDTQPGQVFHLNYAFSREMRPGLRLGVTGYYLKQTTPDRVNGVAQPGSEERVFAAGPGLVFQNPAFTLMLSHPMETAVRNRFKGSRTTLELIAKF